MESINGWAKAEMFIDFRINAADDVKKAVGEYIRFFNEGRPAYCLGYQTPVQYRAAYESAKGA
jgi:putative transposase